MDREDEQRVCMMVVHAGCFTEFDAILMKPFISELLFATVHGVIVQLCFVGRLSVHLRLFSPQQPHHGCTRATGSPVPEVCSSVGAGEGSRTKDGAAGPCIRRQRAAACISQLPKCF